MKRYYGVDFEKQRELLLNSDKAKPFIDKIISNADAAIEKTYKALKMSEYMLFTETGDRKIYQSTYFEKRNDCSYMSIAYWLTGDEKYLKPLIDLVYIICDEFTWCLPAHVGAYGAKPSVEQMIETIDLFQSETARLLTDIIAAVGDKLPYYVNERVEFEIRRRIIAPMTKYDFGWKYGTNNWAAVCGGGTATALLHFGTDDEIGTILPMIYNAMESFLSGFHDDGCCMEGYSYWCYGFGYFVIFARMIFDYTKGEVNYFTREKVKNIALFPQHIRMSRDKVVSFSDGSTDFTFSIGLMSYLKELYGDDFKRPDISLGTKRGNVYSIRELLWFDVNYESDEQKNSTHYFDGAQWYINRGEKLSFAAKGGNNDEPHNHNDIGSFMIVTKDGDIPLADFGCAIYRRETFNNETRYTLINNGSQGHSVPIINDTYQIAGKEYAAENVVADGNKFSLEIQGAYEKGIINKILRSFEVKPSSVFIKDEFVYSDKTESIKERMVSWTKPEIGNGCVDFGTAEVKFDENKYSTAVTVDSYQLHVGPGEATVYLVDFIPKSNDEKVFEAEIIIKEHK